MLLSYHALSGSEQAHKQGHAVHKAALCHEDHLNATALGTCSVYIRFRYGSAVFVAHRLRSRSLLLLAFHFPDLSEESVCPLRCVDTGSEVMHLPSDLWITQCNSVKTAGKHR